ncbi:MAG: sigma-70 family RNA polymerase sigma factor [Acidobacteria bacterium]|nr:sigma-70 family RNA polymerase sigma factor [Acidobacteriota bacterium]MBV9476088.1 sigma-70 family RNA polymerase sigma factor [Acidobacteriota bacterium]
MLEQNASDGSTGASPRRSEKKLQADANRIESEPGAQPLPPTQAADDVEALYIQHRKLLLYVACRKFRIPESDAESLTQEVFLSFLQNGTKIDNVRAWLVAAMCNASRHFWRASGRTESLPDDFNDHSDPDSVGLADQFAMRMTVHQALEYLQPRCRETLYLHYFEGRSANDVARELETTNRYAEKLIHNCLKRVREIYLNITNVQKSPK